MKLHVDWAGKHWVVDLSRPMDVSLSLEPSSARAWYVPPMRISPVLLPMVTGSVKLGGNVNFRDVWFNPHGHGTHTECVGHITANEVSVQSCFPIMCAAQVVSIHPEEWKKEVEWAHKGDAIITREALEAELTLPMAEAVLVRTLPNMDEKLSKVYSGTNFPFFEPDALGFLAENGVRHVLVDLPSVDREEDGGKLLAHRRFWFRNGEYDERATITEFIYIPDTLPDGLYWLHIESVSLTNDATPSRPVLYPLQKA
jgi:arylformamidase